MPSSNRIGSRRVVTALVAIAAAGATLVEVAVAYPDASPWGASNPDSAESCGSCHYDYAPVNDSDAVRIDGLPDTVSPGTVYELGIGMTGVDAAVSGFQLVATAGEFRTLDESLESTGDAVRSTQTARYVESVAWTLSWQAPDRGCQPIELFLAVSASNDDQSPFGDTIHYRRIVIRLSPCGSGKE